MTARRDGRRSRERLMLPVLDHGCFRSVAIHCVV
jgi:hypothetical protein